ncbi:MAG TPA: ferredoxin--NADP reductase [Flavitalea sp.]|nr:ferredoxin--NADP reductase [Flavitalea sp.]
MDSAEILPAALLRIKEITRETEEARSFVLEPIGLAPEYKAGQFLTFLFTSWTGLPTRRSYSISSSPCLNEPLTITVKRVVNGEFSRKLVNKAEAGDVLETIGASGFFILPSQPDDYEEYVFFAAGSGITPVYSLIRTLLYLHPGKRVLLIYSNTSVATTIFHESLRALEVKYGPYFRIRFLYSQRSIVSEARLNPELLEDLLKDYQVSTKSLFYLCGPPAYMRMIYFKLLTLGVTAGRVRREIFLAEKIIEIRKPPDLRPQKVTILAGGQEFRIRVQYPVTILQAARLAGIAIPYSCEAGQCGTCVASCVEGEVWMAQNEVLVEEDLRMGRVLTCTGFPVGGPAVLKL